MALQEGASASSAASQVTGPASAHPGEMEEAAVVGTAAVAVVVAAVVVAVGAGKAPQVADSSRTATLGPRLGFCNRP